jgi:hypothetical protein
MSQVDTLTASVAVLALTTAYLVANPNLRASLTSAFMPQSTAYTPRNEIRNQVKTPQAIGMRRAKSFANEILSRTVPSKGKRGYSFDGMR